MQRSWVSLVVFGVIGASACASTPEPQPAAPSTPLSPSNVPSAPLPSASALALVAPPPAAPSTDPAPLAPTAAPEPPPIPKGTAVLLIGDSFALAGFSKALKPRMIALGARYEVRAETSSFTTTWSAKIDRLVADTQPDLVIINLGANEVANTDPPAHAPAVRKIVRAIGDRPCVWVAPPLWRKDTGITEVIRQNSAPCRFYDSTALVTRPIPRQGDHIHPNEEGGAIWADAFWSWLNDQRDGSAGASEPKPRPWRLKAAPADEHQSPAPSAKNSGDASAP
jgi:hypothetical protein